LAIFQAYLAWPVVPEGIKEIYGDYTVAVFTG